MRRGGIDRTVCKCVKLWLKIGNLEKMGNVEEVKEFSHIVHK
jgi:hypothetical protein